MFIIEKHEVLCYQLAYSLLRLRIYPFLQFSVQAVHARADAKVKELQQSIDRLKAESETFEVTLWGLVIPD